MTTPVLSALQSITSLTVPLPHEVHPGIISILNGKETKAQRVYVATSPLHRQEGGEHADFRFAATERGRQRIPD